MEISLNSNGLGGIGMGRGMPDVRQTGAGHETADASQVARRTSLQVSSPSADARTAGLASSEPVADVPDEALSRDDALGRLVNAAFSLPPPPMPAFTD